MSLHAYFGRIVVDRFVANSSFRRMPPKHFGYSRARDVMVPEVEPHPAGSAQTIFVFSSSTTNTTK